MRQVRSSTQEEEQNEGSTMLMMKRGLPVHSHEASEPISVTSSGVRFSIMRTCTVSTSDRSTVRSPCGNGKLEEEGASGRAGAAEDLKKKQKQKQKQKKKKKRKVELTTPRTVGGQAAGKVGEDLAEVGRALDTAVEHRVKEGRHADLHGGVAALLVGLC
jgi:hypothetical protein